MRRRSIALALVATLAGPAEARQVTTDQRALEQLGPAHRAAPARPHAPPHAAAARTAHPAHSAPHRTVAAPVPRRIGTPPKIPLHPPPPAIIAPPPLHVELHKPPLPPVPPADPKAPGVASAIPGGTEITFGPGVSSLNPATEAALQELARRAAAAPDDVVDIASYAAPLEEDPSTPRRLSLQRALVARSVLIAAGIATTRIYPRALGAVLEPPLGSVSPQPDDRIEVVLQHPDRTVDDGSRKVTASGTREAK